jgi:hypothetical protein
VGGLLLFFGGIETPTRFSTHERKRFVTRYEKESRRDVCRKSPYQVTTVTHKTGSFFYFYFECLNNNWGVWNCHDEMKRVTSRVVGLFRFR